MAKKYACITKFHLDGTVLATIEQVPPDTVDSHRETTLYDEYTDVFDTLEEAEDWKKEACQT